jgi:hypothetical protein
VNDPEFDPQEQVVINRLTNAPQPSLEPDAFEAIRVQMLAAMDVPQLPPKSLKPGQQLWSHTPIIAVVAVTIALVSSIAIYISNSSGVKSAPTVAPTFVPTLTIIPSTQAIPTDAAIPTLSLIPEIIGETTPEVTATLAPVIVVEGPVQAINGAVITIFGVDITLNADDPILAVLQVGDVVHIEADYAADTTTIVAVTVEPISNEVNVNPATGETWRDNGDCSNPPPPWALASGWRRRCGAAPANSNPPGNGDDKGMGMGN